MTCKHIGSAIVCTQTWARLHVGNRYITMEFHPYCGPMFFTDRACTQIYDPVEGDPVWPLFTKWYDQYKAAKGEV